MKNLKSCIGTTLPMLSLSALLTGCSANFNSVSLGTGSVQGAAIQGKLMGGQQPVKGARVYMFAEPSSTDSATRTYGSAAVSLLTSTMPGVQVDGSGNGYVLSSATDGTFHITGDYHCPTQNAQVYMLARGGDPGIGTGTNNEASVMMTALGTCGNLSSSSFIQINELTTVAGVFALQQFMTGPTNLGTTPTNELGLQNAFLTAQMLVSTATGLPQTSTSTVTYPVAKIYTLGNAVAGCVNSASSASTTCTSFLGAAVNPVTSAVPTDVLDALLNIAHYPASNPSGIFNSLPATTAWGNSLSTAPADFSLALSYTGGGLHSARNIAVDGLGDVWVANCGSSCDTTTTQQDSIVVIQHNGLMGSGDVLSGTGFGVGSVHSVQGMALDESNALWAVNSTPSLTVVQNSGLVFNTITNSSGIFNAPQGIAIDTTGMGWVANTGGGNIKSLSASGTVGSTLTAAGMIAPTGVAIDPNGDIVVTDAGSISAAGGTVIFLPNGTGGYGSVYSQVGARHPSTVALDHSHNIWEIDSSALRLYKLQFDGVAASDVPSSGISLTASAVQGLAIDGAGQAIVPICFATCTSSTSDPKDSLVFLSNAGASVNGLSGLQDASLANPVGVAADGSGNVWVANAKTGAVTQFVGVAGPVLTPISGAVFNSKVGVKP